MANQLFRWTVKRRAFFRLLNSNVMCKGYHVKYSSITSMLILIIACIPSAHSGATPKLPYIDDGACPFEGCVYGKWKATEEVMALKEPKNAAPLAFTIKKDEQVNALTGFVVTNKVGISKVIKPIKMGYLQNSSDNEEKLNLKPGEIIYTLHYMGEGFDLFWYQGKIYSDEISDEPNPNPSPDLLLQVISRPDYDWWVEIENQKSEIGWIKNPPYFEGSDQFAYLLRRIPLRKS
jgi:hypothetical protein